MSQAGIVSDTTSGAPDIETLTGDVGGAVSPDAAFNINLLTGDGLVSTGNPATNTITWSLDGLNYGTGQTIGAVTDDLITIDLGATPTTYIIEAKIAGFETATPSGVVYNIICGARTTGAAATITAAQDKYSGEEAALGACSASFVTVGNTVVLQVTGTAGLTIDWKASTTQFGV